MDLRNTVAIVTGAGSGIGREIAIDLARHGCTPVLVDIHADRLARALKDVIPHAPSASAEACDVSDSSRIGEVVHDVRDRHGRIDILVNNAAIMNVKLFRDMSEADLRSHMDVNYFGPLALIRAVAPVMRQQGKGVIINIASVGGKLVVPGTSAYAASKAALHAFSEALHYELKDEGIHVGVIVPGGIRTGIFDAVDTKLGAYYRDQCSTPPAKIMGSIRRAIEKERFETVVPAASMALLALHAHLGGIFRRSLLKRLRPYLE